ncbi:hypothetical protein QE357_005167 [Siphonobacter sp. BAB-5404]|nr:hypothetical protein [Siphonobacter sp. SORGH_AS_0500]
MKANSTNSLTTLKTMKALIVNLSVSLFFIYALACKEYIIRIIAVHKDDTSANVNETDIPFKVAQGYYINNSVHGRLAYPNIYTQHDLDTFFSSSSMMGKEEISTSIDFSKQFVIALTEPKVEEDFFLHPISLKKDREGQIILNYKKELGLKQTYASTAFVLIIVDKKYDASVVLNEIDE